MAFPNRTLGIYRSASGAWEVDKFVHGRRLRERFQSERDAKEWLARETTKVDGTVRFGEVPRITFADAVDRRLREKLEAEMPSAEADANHLKVLLPFVGDLYLDQINDASFDPFRRHREVQEGRRRRFTCPFPPPRRRQLLRLQAAVESIVEPPEDEDISILTLIEQHLRTRPRGA